MVRKHAIEVKGRSNPDCVNSSSLEDIVWDAPLGLLLFF